MEKKTSFRKYYDTLPSRTVKAPKSAFVRHIASICKVSEKTVRCWLAGTQKPDALRISIISKDMNIPEDILFK